MNLAGSLGPLMVTVLLQYYNWRTILAVSGVFCAAFSFVCLGFVKNEPKDVGLPNIEATPKKSAKGGKQNTGLLLKCTATDGIFLLSATWMFSCEQWDWLTCVSVLCSQQ